jgi:hypothetical protein
MRGNFISPRLAVRDEISFWQDGVPKYFDKFFVTLITCPFSEQVEGRKKGSLLDSVH